MYKFIYLSVFLFIACNQSDKESKSAATIFSCGQWIDLSYDFSDKTLYWPTANGFKLDISFVGVTPVGFYYEAFNYCAAEHGGTHLDAPAHFAKGKWSKDRIPLESLLG